MASHERDVRQLSGGVRLASAMSQHSGMCQDGRWGRGGHACDDAGMHWVINVQVGKQPSETESRFSYANAQAGMFCLLIPQDIQSHQNVSAVFVKLRVHTTPTLLHTVSLYDILKVVLRFACHRFEGQVTSGEP